jgi:hypothetical protein
MRKSLIAISLIAAALTLPSFANAQDAAAGAATGAAVGAGTGLVVGGPVGAAVGAGVGGTVGAAAGDSNRAPAGSNTTVVVPATSESCAVDSYGNRTCVRR